MKTNKQSKIVVPKSGFKRSRFNWSHDVNTTFSWGEVQPTQCKLLIPNSKTTFDAQSLIRLAPMVAPTFGRVKYKTYNQFVSLAEIMPNFDAMMAQEPVSTAYGTKVPQAIPSITLGLLSSWCLQGARATFYYALPGTYVGQSMTAAQAAAAGYYTTSYRNTPTSAVESTMATHLANVTSYGAISSSPASDAFNFAGNGVLPEVNGITLSLGKFTSGSVPYNIFGTTTPVVLGAKSLADLCPVVRSFAGAGANVIKDYQREVTMESADLVLEGAVEYSSGNWEYFALALEFSDYGKRLRKFIQGLGYQVNLTSTARVSILPLLATYKAYFDIFGLELYQGWETTYCAKLIKYIENNFVTDVDSIFVRDGKSALATIDNSNIGVPFMMLEVANLWYTDDVDYVSAHLSKLAVSPVADVGASSGFINLDGSGNVLKYGLGIAPTVTDQATHFDDTTDSQNDNGNSNVPGNGQVGGLYSTLYTHHTQLDADMLKRMYRWTNRNTILGRRIAELLRAQGLGKYVDECKSNYIGSTDTMVTISDVVSTAATADASLGEFGGKGLQYVNDRTLVFENDSYGFWITLACVVPESGYTQGLDSTLTSLTKMNLYNPDFDAIGMEATPKWNILHTNYIVGGSDAGGQTFGFIPRYSKFKVAQNLVNGDFNRHNQRNTYLPYTLDKQLNVNDYSVLASDYDEVTKLCTTLLDKSLRTNNLPIAGNVWRYPTKFNWLGNFDRIFLRVGDRDDSDLASATDSSAVGWTDYNPDNFLSHSIYNVQCYAPMKPIEDSYGLEEDRNPTAGVEMASKA